MSDLYKNISDRAYFKYVSDPNQNPIFNWDSARREELLEQKIREEAYLMHQRTHGDALADYQKAKDMIKDRIRFIAYHIHEQNYGEKPIDSWAKAEEIYINNF